MLKMIDSESLVVIQPHGVWATASDRWHVQAIQCENHCLRHALRLLPHALLRALRPSLPLALLCPASPLSDVDDLINWLADAYGSLAMVDYPIPTSFLMPLPAYPIREVRPLQPPSGWSCACHQLFERVLWQVSHSLQGRSLPRPPYLCELPLAFIILRCSSLISLLSPAGARPQVCKALDSLPPGSDLLDRVFAGVSVYYNFSGADACFDAHADPHGESGWQFQVGSSPSPHALPPRIISPRCVFFYAAPPRVSPR